MLSGRRRIVAADHCLPMVGMIWLFGRFPAVITLGFVAECVPLLEEGDLI